MTEPSPAAGKASLGWRIVYLVQRLISRLAPPLHSLHWKILALLLVGLFLPAVYFLWQVRLNIERSHLRSTEQGMIDTALVLADAVGVQSLPDLPVTREVKRRVFRDLSPGLRAVIYDGQGRVVSDSDGTLAPGTPGTGKKDVRTALTGKYGSRWERDPYRRVLTLHSSLPVFRDGEVVGVVSVIKPTFDVRRSILKSLKDLAGPALLAFALAVGTSYLLSSYLTRVISGMAARAKRVAAGETGVRLETWTKSELGDLARAVETMRRKLEGKAYVEEMTSTLSHELKTPLASIRGATEIIESSPDAQTRATFLANVRAEVDRLTDMVNNLLALSRIETAPAPAHASCQMAEIAQRVANAARERAASFRIDFTATIAGSDQRIGVDGGQLRRVLEILIDNALAFTPAGKAVRFETSENTARISDEGCGIERDLQQRVFERFFTTVNPHTGRRGTGLGLAIAKSIVTRSKGEITLESEPGKGTALLVRFPLVP